MPKYCSFVVYISTVPTDSLIINDLSGCKIAPRLDIRLGAIFQNTCDRNKTQRIRTWNVQIIPIENRKAGKYINTNENTRYRHIRFMRNTLARINFFSSFN